MSNDVFWNPLFERIPGDKQSRIMNAAAAVFAEHGLTGANTSSIADLAGISIGSLFNYFPTKERLYLAVVEYGLSTLNEKLTPILNTDLPILERISLILDVIFDSRELYDDLNRVYHRFTTDSDNERAGRLSKRLEGITSDAYSIMITEAKTAGEIETEIDPRVAAFCIDNIFLMVQFSMSSAYFQNRMKLYLGDLSESREKLKEGIMTFIESALQGKREQ